MDVFLICTMNQIFHVFRYAHMLNATFRRLQNRERELEAILHGHNSIENANSNENKDILSEDNKLDNDATTAFSATSPSGSSVKRRIEVAWAADHPCSGKTNLLPWDQRRTCVSSLLAVSRALSLADDCLRHQRSSTKSKSTSMSSTSRSSKNAYDVGVGRNTNRRSSRGADLDDWPGEGRKSGSIVAMLDVDTWEAVSNSEKRRNKEMSDTIGNSRLSYLHP